MPLNCSYFKTANFSLCDSLPKNTKVNIIEYVLFPSIPSPEEREHAKHRAKNTAQVNALGHNSNLRQQNEVKPRIGGKTSASGVVGGRKGASGAVLNDIRDLGLKDPPESAQKPSPELDLRRATVTPGSTGRKAGMARGSLHTGSPRPRSKSSQETWVLGLFQSPRNFWWAKEWRLAFQAPGKRREGVTG